MSDALTPQQVYGMLPTYVEINKLDNVRRKPYEVKVYDDVAVYYTGRHRTRDKARDAAAKAVEKVTRAKGA